MDQIFKFQEGSIYITTFYKMSKVLNKREPSAVTVCAICTTSLIFIVFNKKTRQPILSNKILTIKKSFYYDYQVFTLLLKKSLSQPLLKILYSHSRWESLF